MTAVPIRQPQPQPEQRLTHADLPGVTVEFLLVTPAMAAEILKVHNTRNRKQRERGIAAYARDMSNGAFPFNGDTVCFAADGGLLDGQHRLFAIVKSGQAQLMLVVRGLSPETQKTMDSGILRAFADQLKLGGELNYHLLAATVRKISLWESGAYLFETNLKLSHAELAATLQEHPEARDSTSFALRHRNTKLAPSIIAMAHWLLRPVNPDETEWFLGRVNDGVNLCAGHPALLLRERLQRNLAQRIRLSEGEQLALLIQGWNAYRDGRMGQNHLKIPINLSVTNFPVPR